MCEKSYLGLVRELMKIHDFDSSWNLVRWYCCGEINSQVRQERRENVNSKRQVGDKYLLIPRLRKIECSLGVGSLEEFFEQKEIIQEGLSLNGFINYLGKLKQGYLNSCLDQRLLDL